MKSLFVKSVYSFFFDLRIKIASSITKNPDKGVLEEYRKSIKVYDAFYFFNELELLEVRLNVLNDYVDYFVLIESTVTFSGLKKKLFYDENKERFAKFSHKIIHYIITDTPSNESDLTLRLLKPDISELEKEVIDYSLTTDNFSKGENHWLREFYQKESLKKALVHLNDNDICYISDVDEIWNPGVVVDYRKDYIYKMKQVAYYYYFNNRTNDDWGNWTGTVVTKFKNIKHNCINHLRTATKNKYKVLLNGGWHFTFIGGADRIREKLKSYGHQEFNTKSITDKIEKVLLDNKDYRGRKLKFTVDERFLPKYLIDNKNKFKELFK